MPLVLPFELVDTILHQVQTDKPTLLSCALVSRSWLTRCRILLFSTLRINGGNPEQSFGRFANFIASSPHIRIKVQQLELYGDFPLKPPVLVQDTMTTILNNLPRLQTLSLSQVVFQPFHQAMTTKPSHRLQKLIITGCPVESRGDAASGHDFSGYWAVIALFAQIKHLHIGDLLTFLTGEDHLGPPTLSFQVDSEIEAFTIGYNAHTASMISSFRSFASQRTLKTIEVSCFCPSDLREFGELLREAAVYVRHAGICVSDGAPLFHTEVPREVWNSFYGPSSTFLSSFALEFQVYSPGTMEQTVHLLQSIEPCPHISRILHHLKIQLLLPDDVADALSQISDLSWESFALGVSRHTSIKTVKVVIGDWFGDRVEPRLEEIASIRQALSSLDERAVLEVYEEKIEFEMIQSLHP